MTTVLAFDCAVSGLDVAVVRDRVVLASRREEGREQAANLLPAIAAALSDAGVERRAIELIAVTTGPGSFTGVRVGLATARGLAMALGVPLAGITTTATLLSQAEGNDGLVAAAIDSHLGDWFCAFRADGSEPFIASTEELAERIGGRPCLVVGPQAASLASLLPNAAAQVALPEAAAIARLALELGAAGWAERNRTEGLPRPLYLRGVNITMPDGARRTVD